MRTLFSLVLLSGASSVASAQSFQLLATVSPPGSISNPANWQAVKRFDFAAPGAPAVPATDIPASQLFDPAGIGFRSATDLFIGNRHGNVLGAGSISRFTLSDDGDTVTPNGNFTAPGMIGVHDIAFSPVTGELFAAAVNNGIFRFRFEGGVPVPNGQFAAGIPMRGVAVHPNGRFVYATSFSNIVRVFRIELDNTVTPLAPVPLPAASNLHFFAVHPDGAQLYIGDIDANRVYRLRMALGGELQLIESVASPGAIDIAFSPDAQEMFVGNHYGGGISRFTFDALNNTWTPGGFIATPGMGAFAIYTPTDRPCFPDFNGDGNLDPDDLSDYIACYFTQPCASADYNADGSADPDDLADYIADYFNGCV